MKAMGMPAGVVMKPWYYQSRQRNGARTFTIECRECEHRGFSERMTRDELILLLDSGDKRCPECGGRMVEG